MKVIFVEDVPNVARAGDIKEVADGYGRNYLVPKKLATVATARAIEDAKVEVQRRARQRAKTEADMKELSSLLDGQEVVLTAKTGGNQKLYGSVTAEDIAGAIEKDLGSVVDKRKIDVPEPIRHLGSYDVVLRFAADIAATIKVTVKGEEAE